MAILKPKTYIGIIAPLHKIAKQLDELQAIHDTAIKDNHGAIAELQADNESLTKEAEQAAKVRSNIAGLLAI